MKSFKYTINGNVYKVHINSVVDDIADVEVNGTPYQVKLEKPAKDSELFTFAQERSWKKQLDENILSSVSALLWDYEHCLSRIRACRAPVKGQQRKTDIDRILYAR